MKKIITNNLYLRKLLVKDITPNYVNALNDPEIVRLTGARHEKWNKENVKKYVIESNIKNISQLVGIFLKKNNKHIGNIRLFNFNFHHKRVELGIMIFDKTEWSKGYGTESLNAISIYVFKTLKLHRICADYYAINIGSARIFKKAGFIVEGIFKDHFILNGKYVDSIRVAKLDFKEGEKNEY